MNPKAVAGGLLGAGAYAALGSYYEPGMDAQLPNGVTIDGGTMRLVLAVACALLPFISDKFPIIAPFVKMIENFLKKQKGDEDLPEAEADEKGETTGVKLDRMNKYLARIAKATEDWE